MSHDKFLLKLETALQKAAEEDPALFLILSFVKTVSQFHKTDEYEIRLLFQALTDKSVKPDFTVLYDSGSFHKTVEEIIEDTKEFPKVFRESESVQEVILWHEQQLPYTPASVFTKAKRLHDAIQRLADKG